MNTYRNKKTGAEIVTPCKCAGEDWEPVKAPTPPKKTGAKTKETQK